MKDNLLSLNISQYSAQFINELKYQVRNYPKTYTSETAKEVESVFVQILLKNMRNTLSQDSLLENNQSRLYTDIYDQHISLEVSKKGIGLAQIILKQIQKSQNIKLVKNKDSA